MTKPIKKLLELKILIKIVVAYTLVITFLFLLPKQDLPIVETDLPIDKIGHVLLHFLLVFGWLLVFFVMNEKQISSIKIWQVITVCFVYGIVIEIIQELLIPLRQADFFDVLANTVGLLIGFTLFWYQKNKFFS